MRNSSSSAVQTVVSRDPSPPAKGDTFNPPIENRKDYVMPLTISDKIKIICVFGAAILTGLILFGIREWYSPDIRYEEGSFYISGKNAITSLILKNYGHADADDVIITTHFENNINDISIEDKSLEVKILNGGIGNKNVIIKIIKNSP